MQQVEGSGWKKARSSTVESWVEVELVRQNKAPLVFF